MMSGILRQAACLAVLSALVMIPAPVRAQTTCEYGAAMTPAQAGGAAMLGADGEAASEPPQGQPAPQSRPAMSGIANAIGAAGHGVVGALGGDTSEVDRAMEEQRQREAEIGALLGILAAAPC